MIFLQPLLMSLMNPGMWCFFLMFAGPVLVRMIRGEDPAPAESPAPAAAAIKSSPAAEPLPQEETPVTEPLPQEESPS